jgi:hypothetical protein
MTDNTPTEFETRCRWCNGSILSMQFAPQLSDDYLKGALSLHEDGCKSRPADARFNYQTEA